MSDMTHPHEYEYITRFESLGFGLFVHFGLYSMVGRGEWYLHLDPDADADKYNALADRFCPTKNWARELAKKAKKTGCKYITLTARHHDGFSLYDTCGLSEFDVMHSKYGRDLIAEFTDACREYDIVPFFYHTLLDWQDERYKNDFPAYMDYLIDSIEILCTRYGKIGGFWFDGMWDKPDEDWQEDRLYGAIRKHQPEAMIINNTGLSAQGKVGHPEIDSVTFERGNPTFVDQTDKHRAGEMCQVLNDHWGYAENDCNYKSVGELIENLVDCRRYGCNFLLNTGLRGKGGISPMDSAMLDRIGKWVRANKGFIYTARPAELEAENCELLFDGEYYYAVIKNVAMSIDANVTLSHDAKTVKLPFDIARAVWLDNGREIKTDKNSFVVEPYAYGESYSVRVARITKDSILK